MTTPAIKVFDASGTYQASTHDYAAAATLMGLYGDGATVRLGHAKKDTVWTEGKDGAAWENYDLVGEAIEAYYAEQRAILEKMLAS